MICDLLSEILPHLGKDPGDPAEGLIATLHGHAEQLVKAHLGSSLETGAFTDVLPPGTDAPGLALQLRNVPVRSITSVYATWTPGGAGWPASNLLSPDAYYLDSEEPGLCRSGLLYRVDGLTWPAVPRSVRVSYQGGWTPDELATGEAQAISLAVKQTVAKLWRETEAYFDNASGGAGVGPLVSENIMGWQQSFNAEAVRQVCGMQTDLPASVKAILAPFVNVGAKLGALR